jgi:uncharacterized protein (TIGR03492 family)
VETTPNGERTALLRTSFGDGGGFVQRLTSSEKFSNQHSLLVLSNGHGEDEIAVRVLDELRAAAKHPLNVGVWPLVGKGHAYRRRGWPIVGATNCLPGEGFGTLDARLMLRDLRAHWIGNHWRQFRSTLSLAGRYRLSMVVGDIVPTLAAAVIRTPFVFIGSAKSAYSGLRHTYSWPERLLLRRNCRMIYPRDAMTAAELDGFGLPVRFVGNPMMDGLAGSGAGFDIDGDALVITMLAGSRADAEINTVDLLGIAQRLAEHFGPARNLHFLFPAHPDLNFDRVRQLLGSRNMAWHCVDKNSGAETGAASTIDFQANAAVAHLVKDRFADCLLQAEIAIGMAGTANEQAIGLGVPLIVVPASGVQGDRYVRMKMKYFGDAAIAVKPDPQEVVKAVNRILGDPTLRSEMVRAGRARMGESGASASIARDILGLIASEQ